MCASVHINFGAKSVIAAAINMCVILAQSANILPAIALDRNCDLAIEVAKFNAEHSEA